MSFLIDMPKFCKSPYGAVESVSVSETESREFESR